MCERCRSEFSAQEKNIISLIIKISQIRRKKRGWTRAYAAIYSKKVINAVLYGLLEDANPKASEVKARVSARFHKI